MEKKIIIPQLTFNEKCPVCLEKDGDFFSLGCLHKIHLECCENLRSMECPLCRRYMEELPECLQEKIIETSKKEEEIRLQEEREELSRTYINTHQTFLLHRPTPQMEAIAALDFLRENGIPMFYLPITIEITLFRNNPLPHPGIIFQTILRMILDKIAEDCIDVDLEEEDDEECFFEEDDNQRNIRVRKL